MILTQEIRNKIDEAWSYQAATSCGWAMSELDRFAVAALYKGKIEVEGYSSEINNLKDFFVWKKQDFGMSQIPVLRGIPYDRLIDIVNGLIIEFSIDHIVLKETDVNNHYFQLKFCCQTGGFDVEIGKILNNERLGEKIEKWKSLKMIFITEKHYRLTYEIEINKFLGLGNGVKKKSFEFNRLEIR